MKTRAAIESFTRMPLAVMSRLKERRECGFVEQDVNTGRRPFNNRHKHNRIYYLGFILHPGSSILAQQESDNGPLTAVYTELSAWEIPRCSRLAAMLTILRSSFIG